MAKTLPNSILSASDTLCGLKDTNRLKGKNEIQNNGICRLCVSHVALFGNFFWWIIFSLGKSMQIHKRETHDRISR